MSKRSLRWLVVTAMGTLAPNALAQPAAPKEPKEVKEPTSEAQADSPSASPKDVKPKDYGSGIFVETSTSSSGIAPTEAAAVTEPFPALELNPATTGGDNKPWMQQLLPTDGLVEIGVVTGLLFPSRVLNLQSQTAHHQHLATAPELGARIAYFPIKYAGAELEYVVGFSKTDKDNQPASPWAFRGELIGQYPGWRVTPFALIGGGRMGVISSTMGSDGDPLFHWGVGAKAALSPMLMARLDIRDNMAQKHGSSDGTLCNSFELLLGLSVTLGRPEPPPPQLVKDTDGDGLVDRVDKCPNEAGVGADGCPPKDTDGDGVMDNSDKCPNLYADTTDGCPPKDSDNDGVPDAKDKCPNEKGERPSGCPATRDSDGDGILDAQDQCPNDAETKNGFEDDDGCPDELPAQVKAFTGIIKGIEFDKDRASITASSSTILDASTSVLMQYPSLRVLIAGHTDNTGGRDKNVLLSQERAESVKAYLVGKGVNPSRIETRGAGPDEPIDSNTTAIGRQQNRRIEFKLLMDSE